MPDLVCALISFVYMVLGFSAFSSKYEFGYFSMVELDWVASIVLIPSHHIMVVLLLLGLSCICHTHYVMFP